jgi:hypothetical protein
MTIGKGINFDATQNSDETAWTLDGIKASTMRHVQ